MNKKLFLCIAFFTFTGINSIQSSDNNTNATSTAKSTAAFSAATINWPFVMGALQSSMNSLAHFTSAVNSEATSLMMDQQNASVSHADNCIRPVYYAIQAIMDLYHQNILTSNPQYVANGPCIPVPGSPGLCTMIKYPFPMSTTISNLEMSGGPLTNFYKSIIGAYNSSTIPENLRDNTMINLDLIKKSTFITPSSYSNQSLQYLSTEILSLANNIAKLSITMTNDINNNSDAITNNIAVKASENPLNANTLKCQIIQDLAFINSSIFIYIANIITNTPKSATMLYTPQISCSDTIAQSFMAVINPPANTSKLALINGVLNGTISGRIPLVTRTIEITPMIIFASICAFVLAYDANSTTGPFQPVINDLITANNRLQSL